MSHLVLIDGHHLMYRAYWAIPRTLKTSSGEQSNAVFGMASMLLSILASEEPDALLVAFDEGEETVRHEEYDAYKEGRAETPDDFYTQIPRILQLVDAFGFETVSDTKYEADDFIGSYAVAAAREGSRVTIISGDKDLFQLADTSIRIAIPHKGYRETEYLHSSDVETKLGVRPDQVPSYKGLCGDSSDNLPGVVGIGPKGAVTLLSDYGDLDGIYAHLDELRPAVRSKLERDREQAYFCERMARLILDIPLPIALEDTSLSDIDLTELASFFSAMEFTLLQKRLQSLLQSDYGAAHFTGSVAPIATPRSSGGAPAQLSMFEGE